MGKKILGRSVMTGSALAYRNIATINNSSVIRWISVSTVKELFTSIDCKLDSHSNTLKEVSMLWNLMPKLLCQTTPSLEVIVDRLLPDLNVLLYVFSLFQIFEASWTHAALGMLSNISIISFNSLIWSKVGLQ